MNQKNKRVNRRKVGTRKRQVNKRRSVSTRKRNNKRRNPNHKTQVGGWGAGPSTRRGISSVIPVYHQAGGWGAPSPDTTVSNRRRKTN